MVRRLFDQTLSVNGALTKRLNFSRALPELMTIVGFDGTGEF